MAEARTRRTQAERRESTREKVERAAMSAVAARGFEGATVDVIARESGMSRGAVSAHFPAKESLWPVVVDRACAALDRDVARAFDDSQGVGVARVRAALVALLVARVSAEPEQSAWPELHRRAARDPALRERLRPSLASVESALGARAQTLGEAAGLALRTAPAHAGRVILAVVSGLSERCRVDGGALAAEDLSVLSQLVGALWTV
jgi:AcrR family transcriptional regulator